MIEDFLEFRFDKEYDEKVLKILLNDLELHVQAKYITVS